jgi:tetratricopeptide (TPR) repeat protein
VLGVAVLGAIGGLWAWPTIAQPRRINRGVALLLAGDYGGAEIALRGALDHKPSADLANNLGLACQQQQKWDCAQEAYQLALDYHDPQDREAAQAIHFNLALSLDRQEKFLAAETHYRRAISQSGRLRLLALNNLVRVLILKPKISRLDHQLALEEGIVLSAIGLEQVADPQLKAKLLKNQGWGNLLLKQYPLAEAAMEEAIELDSHDPSALFLLAQILEAQGQENQSFVYWQQGLRAISGEDSGQDRDMLMEVREWQTRAWSRLDRELVNHD